ncbi:MAG: GspE/PulE family protein [Acidithiobacillus sp.]
MSLRVDEMQARMPAKMRSFARLVGQDQLLVVKDYIHDPYVESYVTEIRLLGGHLTVSPSTMEEVQAHRMVADGERKGAQQAANKDLREDISGLFIQAAALDASDIHFFVSRRGGGKLYHRRVGKRIFVRDFTSEDAMEYCASLYNTIMDTGDTSWHPTEYQGGSIREARWLPESLYGIRVQSNPTADGVSMALRLLKKDPVRIKNLDHPFEELGFTQAGSLAMEDLTNAGQGLRLALGSTGSGKSTTLKIAMELIARRHPWKNPITIEDPPEYPIIGASQFVVANATDAEDRRQKFNDAFRASMRSDPDVLMVGEIRDATTAHLAWECALSGHETWSTLHANDAVDATERLIEEMGIHPRQVGNLNVLRGMVSQALVPVLCPHCKVPLLQAQGVLDLHLHPHVRVDQAFVTGPGCPRCNGLGAVKQTLVVDVTIPDREFCARVQGRDAGAARDYLQSRWAGKGLLGLDHALGLVNSGLVDPVEAAQKAVASGLIRGRFDD